MARQHVRLRFAAYSMLSNWNVGLAFNEQVVGRVNSMWNDDTVCLLKRNGKFCVMDLWLALK